MDNVQDDRFGVGDPKIDIVAAVNGQAQAYANGIARHAGMAGLGDAVKMIDDFRHETPRGLDTVRRDEIVDFVEISVSQIGNDQVFRRDRASPLEMMSAFIASAPTDFRNSPRE